MVGLESLGKVLLILGILIAGIGIILLFAGRIPFLGRLPGDILIQRDNVTVWIPLATMVVISIVLSILLSIISLAFRR